MTPDPSTLPLRDIHLPPPVGWWPLAPGWWILAAALLLAAGIAFVVHRAHRRRALRRAAQHELRAIAARHAADQDDHRLAMELSMLARRVAVRLAGTRASAVTGAEWLVLLDSLAGTTVFREGPGRALASAPYRPHEAVAADALLAAVAQWLERLPAMDPSRPGPAPAPRSTRRNAPARDAAAARAAGAASPPRARDAAGASGGSAQ